MGMMDKFLNAMRLNADDEDDFYDDDYYDEEEPLYEEEPPKKRTLRRESKPIEEEEVTPKYTPQRESKVQTKAAAKVTPMRPSRRAQTSGAVMEVCVIRPTSVEDAREITETLLNNRTVILNLEGIDLEIGQRIIDFTSGSCFAVDGNLQKISNYIFVVTPASVDISGDISDLMDAFSVSSLHTDI